MAAEGPQMREALKSAQIRSNATMGDGVVIPCDEYGRPMMLVSCAAAELLPTVQYGNITIGPVSVTRFIPDPVVPGAENMTQDECDSKWRELARPRIANIQALCEEVNAEERQSLHLLMRSRVQATERA